MKRRNFYKKLLSVGLALACAVQLAGCSSKGGEDKGGDTQGSNTAGEQKDFVYVAEFQTVDADDLSSSVVKGDTLYYTTGEYDEATEQYIQSICKLKIGETTSEVLPIEVKENTYLGSLNVDDEGNLLVILNSSEGEEEPVNKYYLNKYSQDGTELFSYDLSALDKGGEENSFYIQYMAEDANGNIYLGGSESNVWILDNTGAQIGALTTDNWINSMLTLTNGNVAVSYYGGDGITLQEIDPATKSLGKTYHNLPNAYNNFVAGGENKVLMMGNSKLYEYDIETETSTELLNWVNCDVDGDYIRSVSMLEDGRILAISVDWSQESAKTEMVYLTKKSPSEVAQKETITLGAIYIGQEVKKNVIAFNKANDKYRIEVIEYGAEDWEAGQARFNSDIVSGAGPDIIDLSMSDNVDMYIAKGILEDLTPYLEADTEIKRENYVEKAFNAYEKDGKLYGIVPAFTIQTVIGKTSDVGSEPGWTIDDVMALMDSKPEGTELFEYCTKDSILNYCCIASLDNFVDWETGECKFDDGYFEKVLEFANRFPKESEWNEDDDSTPTKIQSGRLLLQSFSISEMEYYQMYSMMYGEPITFIGYPSNGGSGSYITPTIALGINTKAKQKDGAWEFLRNFLMEDYQENNIEWYFPTLQTALDAMFEEAMTEDYYELDGEKIKQPKTTWGYDDWEAEIYAATKEQVDAVKELIEITDGVFNSNQEIANIISEEAAPFFDGQKSAKDVADVVQSRVKIYVNENR